MPRRSASREKVKRRCASSALRCRSILGPLFLAGLLPWVLARAENLDDQRGRTGQSTVVWKESATVAGVTGKVRVGTCEVFENRETQRGRRIALQIMVLAAEASQPASDALFIIVGGPGQGASANAEFYARVLARVRRERDIVLLDQRGTGGSHPLNADLHGKSLAGLFGDLYPPAAVAAARKELERRADLSLYTTAMAVGDLDEVRAALGYEWIDLFGTSYGTRVAQEYLRRYPARVRSIILKGVVPMDAPFPQDFARDSQRALDRVFERCAADEKARVAFPTLRADFDAVLARLSAGPMPVNLTDPTTGKQETVALSRGTFAVTLRSLLQSISAAAEVPLLIHQAARGDFAPFAHQVLSSRRQHAALVSVGMGLSVASAEEIPRSDPETAQRAAENTFLGNYYYRQMVAACADWPRGKSPPDYAEPVASEVPALLISGFYDPATPPENAESVARHLSNSRHLLIHNASHSYAGLSPALDGVMAEFIVRGSAQELDVSALDRVAFPAFRLPNEKSP